jgi:hypothetical protein
VTGFPQSHVRGSGFNTSRSTAASSGARIFAIPKSSTFTIPSGVTLMVAGFKSRWTMPFSCAASSATAIWRAADSATRTGIGPPPSRSASVGPSTSSRINARTRSVSSTPQNRRDVRMIEGRQDTRFALEARWALDVS